VRYKSYELARVLPDEAVFDMEHLDYDVHLFIDDFTGQQAVIYRGGPTGYRLSRLRQADVPEPRGDVHVAVTRHPAPRLAVRQAVQHLNLTAEPFLFFADPASGRGRLLYRRYDGNYGLVTALR